MWSDVSNVVFAVGCWAGDICVVSRSGFFARLPGGAFNVVFARRAQLYTSVPAGGAFNVVFAVGLRAGARLVGTFLWSAGGTFNVVLARRAHRRRSVSRNFWKVLAAQRGYFVIKVS